MLPLPNAKTPWPKSLPKQAQAVAHGRSRPNAVLSRRRSSQNSSSAARLDRIEDLLDTLVSLGQALALPDGRFIAGITARPKSRRRNRARPQSSLLFHGSSLIAWNQ